MYMDSGFGLDTKLLHYSTCSMQRFCIISGVTGLCVRKEIQPGSAFGRPPSVGTFEDMAQQFFESSCLCLYTMIFDSKRMDVVHKEKQLKLTVAVAGGKTKWYWGLPSSTQRLMVLGNSA